MNSDPILELYALFALVTGLLTCFYGFRIFDHLLGVVGFLIGAGLGGSLASSLSGGSVFIILAGGIFGGAIGAGLMIALFPLALAVFGFLLGALIGAAINDIWALGLESILMILVGVIGAVLSLNFKKLLIVLSTSFDGAAGIVWGGMVLLKSADMLSTMPGSVRDQVSREPMTHLIWLALGLFGVLVQYKITAPESHELRDVPEDVKKWKEQQS